MKRLIFLAALLLGGCSKSCDGWWQSRQLRSYDEAVQEATKALGSGKSDADRAAALVKRARALAEKARYSRFFQKDPLEESQRLFELALKDHEAAIALEPQSAEQVHQRGLTYYSRAFQLPPSEGVDRTAGILALSDFTTAVGIDERHVMAHDFRGLTNLGLGNLDAAIADFEKELKLDPKIGSLRLSDALCERGLKNLKEERRALARADFERSIAMGDSRIGCSCDPHGPLAKLKD